MKGSRNLYSIDLKKQMNFGPHWYNIYTKRIKVELFFLSLSTQAQHLLDSQVFEFGDIRVLSSEISLDLFFERIFSTW